jgi:hypothetical protein
VTVTTRHESDGGGGDDEGGYRRGRGDEEDYTPLAGGYEGMVNSPRKFLVGESGPEYMSVHAPGEGGIDLRGLEEQIRRMNDAQAARDKMMPRWIRDAVLTRN